MIRTFWFRVPCRYIVCWSFWLCRWHCSISAFNAMLKKIIIICEKYANSHSITFNPNKSKLLCFNVDDTDVIPQTNLNCEVIPVVDSDKHLGNYIFTNITDRNIIDNICDLYQRSNRVNSDFSVCDSNALDSLHRTYCMHMYGCEL